MLLPQRSARPPEYYVYNTIYGQPVPSSAVYHGTYKNCEATARRLNAAAGSGSEWKIDRCK
jgi:hypothetical protein